MLSAFASLTLVVRAGPERPHGPRDVLQPADLARHGVRARPGVSLRRRGRAVLAGGRDALALPWARRPMAEPRGVWTRHRNLTGDAAARQHALAVRSPPASGWPGGGLLRLHPSPQRRAGLALPLPSWRDARTLVSGLLRFLVG